MKCAFAVFFKENIAVIPEAFILQPKHNGKLGEMRIYALLFRWHWHTAT